MESDTERDIPLPASAANPSSYPPLRAAKSMAFKREERRKRKDRKRQERLALELEQWEPLAAPPSRPAAATAYSPGSDTPWPCDPTPPQDLVAADSSWSWGPPADPPPEPTVTAASQPHPQAAAVRSCRSFFQEHAYEEEEDEDGEEQEGKGHAARFFGELLGNDAALRGFYEAEREKGRLLCLVCEGTGARTGKRYAGCAALVQHAGSVARTKRRLAHRAFADAVGQLLGWGAGRTAPPPSDQEGCDNDDTSDRADNLGVPQSEEMEVS